MASRRLAALAAALCGPALAVALAACGEAEKSPPRDVRAPATQPETVPPEERQGGAGDEEPIRVPATFTFTAGGVRPTVVAVPAFFTIALRGVSRDGEAHRIVFQGTTIDVPAGGRSGARIEGLKKGRYPVSIDGVENAATIVSGAEPGP